MFHCEVMLDGQQVSLRLACDGQHGFGYGQITGFPNLTANLHEGASYFIFSVPAAYVGKLTEAGCDFLEHVQLPKQEIIHFCFSTSAIHNAAVTVIDAQQRKTLIFSILRCFKEQDFVADAGNTLFNPKRTFFQGLLIYCRDHGISLPNDLKALPTEYAIAEKPIRPQLGNTDGGIIGTPKATAVVTIPAPVWKRDDDPEDDVDEESLDEQNSITGTDLFFFILAGVLLLLTMWAVGGVLSHNLSLFVGSKISSGIGNLSASIVNFLGIDFHVAAVSFPPEAYLGMAIGFGSLLLVLAVLELGLRLRTFYREVQQEEERRCRKYDELNVDSSIDAENDTGAAASSFAPTPSCRQVVTRSRSSLAEGDDLDDTVGAKQDQSQPPVAPSGPSQQ